MDKRDNEVVITTREFELTVSRRRILMRFTSVFDEEVRLAVSVTVVPSIVAAIDCALADGRSHHATLYPTIIASKSNSLDAGAVTLIVSTRERAPELPSGADAGWLEGHATVVITNGVELMELLEAAAHESRHLRPPYAVEGTACV